jgi:hypothetical protein
MDCPSESFRSPKMMMKMSEVVPWLPLYRVWGQVTYKEEGSPDRGVMSLREGTY